MRVCVKSDRRVLPSGQFGNRRAERQKITTGRQQMGRRRCECAPIRGAHSNRAGAKQRARSRRPAGRPPGDTNLRRRVNLFLFLLLRLLLFQFCGATIGASPVVSCAGGGGAHCLRAAVNMIITSARIIVNLAAGANFSLAPNLRAANFITWTSQLSIHAVKLRCWAGAKQRERRRGAKRCAPLA